MKLITTKTLVKRTKTSSKRIASWRQKGMPHYNISTNEHYYPRYRYDEDEVMEWIKREFHRVER